MNQTFTITVDIPNGYESTGEYRIADASEDYLDGDGIVRNSGPTISPVFILRRAWTPPAWLPIDNWLYFRNGQWRITNARPVDDGSGRFSSRVSAVATDVRTFAALHGQTFTPPPEHCNGRVYQL